MISDFIKYLVTLTLLMIPVTPAFNQVAVERSKDKAIISGVPYYIHVAKKGETVYSISRAYGITAEELTRENPPVLHGLKEGQALRIPVRSVTDSPAQVYQPEPLQRDETRYLYHRLQPGETVFFLSRTYGVSENEIIEANPGMEINKLPVGSEIAVPRRVLMSEKEKFDDEVQKYYYHKVLKGETMASIADRYGITVRELRRENRELRFPQVGDYVRIPVQGTPGRPPVAEIIPDIPADEQPAGFHERLPETTPVTRLRGSLDVAVLLPLYLKENSARIEIDSSSVVKGKRTYKVISKPDDWVFSRSIGFIEMYQGILLAVDTLRSLGLDINLHVFDIKSDSIGLLKLIREGKLDRMDLIIGPVYSNNLLIAASYAGKRGIPVVSPVPLTNNSVLRGNPALFMATGSTEVARNTLAREISMYYDHNIVFIHNDPSGENQEVRSLRSGIFQEMSYKIPYEQIKFRELIFYSRSVFGNDSINRLRQALSEQTPNLIVIASEETPVMSETLLDIHALSRKYNIKVLGYPSMRILGNENFDPRVMFDLQLLVFSPYWIDYSERDVKKFNADFYRKFYSQPSEMSYAWQGYDITWYFLSGLTLHGKKFIENPWIHNPDLLHTFFDFRRRSADDGFENNNLFLIRYSSDYEVRLVKRSESFADR
ncbi:MAG: LysM peptidoglycan-binding domain-containing protein [Bacteroidales bacterium]|nr:LysM peptidoglycan-binding domain-containing protein [Bacteroidales bacterium]